MYIFQQMLKASFSVQAANFRRFQTNIINFKFSKDNIFIKPISGCKTYKGQSLLKLNDDCYTNLIFCTFSSSSTKYVSPIHMAYASYKLTSTKNISSAPPIVLMHGLMGSKNNWKSLAKIINQKTGRIVYAVDARNHGDSPHTNDIDYYCLAEDISFFLKEHSIPKACLIGHSMGGRAVMAVALQNPTAVDKLFVLDISPRSESENLSSLPKFVEIMKNANISSDMELNEARKYVDKLLLQVVPHSGMRQFLLLNLMKSGNEFIWKVNLEVIARNFLPNLVAFPKIVGAGPFNGETYFIGGTLSNYIRESDHDEIRTLFPKAKISYIEDAGHWLHADKPNEFLSHIIPLIKS